MSVGDTQQACQAVWAIPSLRIFQLFRMILDCLSHTIGALWEGSGTFWAQIEVYRHASSYRGNPFPPCHGNDSAGRATCLSRAAFFVEANACANLRAPGERVHG